MNSNYEHPDASPLLPVAKIQSGIARHFALLEPLMATEKLASAELSDSKHYSLTDQSLWTASVVAERGSVYQAGNQSQDKDKDKDDAQTPSQDNAIVRLKTFSYEGQELYLPKYDAFFKHIFGSDQLKSKRALADFLTATLNMGEIRPQDLILKNPKSPVHNVGEKNYQLDLLVNVNQEKLVNIEIQLCNEGDLEACSIYYASATMFSQLESGDEFWSLLPTINLWILNFRMFTTDNDWFRDIYYWDRLHDRKYSELSRLTFIELPKIRALKLDAAIANQRRAFEKAQKANADLEKARADFEKALADFEETREEILEEGLALGREEGLALGERKMMEKIVENNLKTARKMLAKGLDFSFISEITGLSEQQIAELVRETATEQEH